MKSSIGSFCTLGLDVGFGNLKLSALNGNSLGQPRECVLPAGAQRMTEWDAGSSSLDGGEAVYIPVNGEAEEWIAGIEPRKLNSTKRVMDDTYPTSAQYAALFAAGLIRSGLSKIDLLVTGLPVKQFYGMGGIDLRAQLKKMMTGRHHVARHCSIEVCEVKVVPQPMGTFSAVLAEPESAKLRPRIKVLSTLSLDIGFGTIDWVLMTGNEVQAVSSHSSPRATGYLLEEASRRVSQELGRIKSRDVLDEALRQGRSVLEVGITRDIDYRKHIAEAAEEVAETVIAEIRSSLRLNDDLDLIMLSGGGATFYEAAVRAAFRGVDVVRAENPVLANARGFRLLAEAELRNRNRAKVA